MADLTEYKFVVNDEAVVNRYGYRILNKSVNTKQFLTNPVCLYQHRRAAEWRDDDVMPIGKWTRFETEGTKLIGYLVFSQVTEKAKTVGEMVAEGTLNACSMGFCILKSSNDPSDLVIGQTRETVTKCDLMEISIVDIPGNQASVQVLSATGQKIENLDAVLPLLTLNQQQPNSAMKKENFIAMLLMFGLAADATEEQLMEAVKQQGADLTVAKAALLKATEAEHQLKAKTLIDTAVANKKLTEAQRTSFEKLALTDYEAAKTAIDSLTPVMAGTKTVTEQLQGRGGNQKPKGDAEDCEYLQLSKTNPKELLRLSKEDPEAFKKLEAEYLETLKA